MRNEPAFEVMYSYIVKPYSAGVPSFPSITAGLGVANLGMRGNHGFYADILNRIPLISAESSKLLNPLQLQEQFSLRKVETIKVKCPPKAPDSMAKSPSSPVRRPLY